MNVFILFTNQGNQHEVHGGANSAYGEKQSLRVLCRQWAEVSSEGCQMWQLWQWWTLSSDLLKGMQEVQIHTLLWTSGLVQCLCIYIVAW